MSLTKFIALPAVRERLRYFSRPTLESGIDLLAPPQSKRFSLVGTAFDYLLRFHIEHRNPRAKQRPWVAEEGLKKLGMQTPTHYDIDTAKFSSGDEALATGQKILKRAKAARERYLASGSITNALLESVIGLAQLDVVHRAGFVDENLGMAYDEDLRDLRKLISLVDPEMFFARKTCLLNPSFGIGSRLIGGADADLLIDDTLIDIKVTKDLSRRQEYFDQLLGYLVMHEIWGVDGLKRKPQITKIGIYFARHASLQVFDVENIVREKTYPSFVQWFRQVVEQQHADRYGKAPDSRLCPPCPLR